jgi:acetyl esterase/lipase
VGATIADGTGVGTITNDDPLPTLSIDDVTLAEGNPPGTTSFGFTVTLSVTSGQAVTVNYATTDGTATTADSDYTAIGSTQLTFNPGETSKPVSVTVQRDLTNEPDEEFTVDLSTPVGATIADGTGLGTITNDDAAAALTILTQPPGNALDGVAFTQSPVVVVEDGGGNPMAGQSVTASIAAGGGSVGGTPIVMTDGSGTATFSDLSIDGDPGLRTLLFSVDAIQTTSAPVHVAYAEGTYLAVQYCGSIAAQRMDVYVPSNSVARPLPVAVYIHGGGWTSGDSSSGLLLPEVRTELLLRGYVVVSVNYRLATASTNKWPAQINDVKCAIRHLRAEAGDYGFDGASIGVWGASAGGHLASMLGVTDASSGFEGSGGYSGVSSRVSAAVPIGGISDMTSTQAPDHPELNFFGPEWAFEATWPGPSTQLDEASPIWWTSSDDPPFLIVHGDQDTTVLPAQATRLDDSLDSAGALTTLQLVTNGGHNLDDVGMGTPSPTLAQVVQQIADFFDAHVVSDP